MSAPPAPGRATYEDLLKVPDNFVAELIDGELYAWPRPRARHLKVQTQLLLSLGPPYQNGDGGPGGWVFYIEPELRLGEDALVPDVAAWRQERLSDEADIIQFTIAPDWVCEVISEGTGRHDRVRKMPIYARHGVPHAWIVDPAESTLEAYRLVDGPRWLLLEVHGGDAEVAVEPFGDVVLRLARFW